MSNVAVPSRSIETRTRPVPSNVVLGAIVLVASGFVARYVFRYYQNYNEAAFTDSVRGAGNYWMMRGWLLAHISAGTGAILFGPWQFWSALSNRNMQLHRLTGRIFLLCVLVGSVTALRLAIDTTFGWAFGVGLASLAVAWLVTSGTAYYAAVRRDFDAHKVWMLRAYVVTFGFVTFRGLTDYGPTSHLQPDGDRIVTFIWMSWAIPLLLTEAILEVRRLQSH